MDSLISGMDTDKKRPVRPHHQKEHTDLYPINHYKAAQQPALRSAQEEQV